MKYVEPGMEIVEVEQNIFMSMSLSVSHIYDVIFLYRVRWREQSLFLWVFRGRGLLSPT